MHLFCIQPLILMNTRKYTGCCLTVLVSGAIRKNRISITMIRFGSIQRLKQHLFVIFVTLFVIFPIRTIIYHQHYVMYDDVLPNSSNKTRYERYCDQVDRGISAEQISNSSIQLDPVGKNIPYSYSRWRSTPLLPRPITQCEHAIYMDLLSILVKHVFKKYSIPYMMVGGTLVGKYIQKRT